MQPHIECISLSKLYSGKKHTIQAVNEVNLQISRNELVLIKGRSGAGKSTLLNLMCGLIKPSSGKVMIDDDCISEISNENLSKLLLNKIGIIFQSFNLLPTYTVYENIEVALAPKISDRRRIEMIVMPLIEQFNLSDKKQSLPPELSIGQQQKVAILRTLVKEPDIIFADEPTGSVDEETASEILNHFSDLKRNRKVTIVIATHGGNPETIADQIILMENGFLKS